MWLRIVWARRSASTTASTVSPTREPAVERAAVDDQARRPAAGCPRPSNSDDPPPASRSVAPVADLAAALGVERRPVEDDLGRAPWPVSSVELASPVADDRDDLGRRRVVVS